MRDEQSMHCTNRCIRTFRLCLISRTFWEIKDFRWFNNDNASQWEMEHQQILPIYPSYHVPSIFVRNRYSILQTLSLSSNTNESLCGHKIECYIKDLSESYSIIKRCNDRGTIDLYYEWRLCMLWILDKLTTWIKWTGARNWL